MIGSDASGQMRAFDMASGGNPSEPCSYGTMLVSNFL